MTFIIPISIFSVVYGLILIASGCVVLFGISRTSADKISPLLLSVGLMVSGLSVVVFVPSPILYVAILTIPYVYATVISILLILSSQKQHLIETLLCVVIVSIPIVLFVRGELFLATYAISVLNIIFALKLRHNYRILSIVMGTLTYFGLVFVILFESLILLHLLEIILVCEASIVFLVLYREKKEFDCEFSTEEIKRKLTHLLAFIILIPLIWADILAEMLDNLLLMIDPNIAIVVTPQNVVRYTVIILGVSVIPLFLAVEYVRITRHSLLIPPDLLRKHEESNIAAYVYTITGAFIVSLFCSQVILITAVITSLMADAMAALVGIYYGKHKITRNRTLEGTMAGFITAIIVTFIIIKSIFAALIVGIVVAIFDALNIKEINDNFIYQILIASTLILLGIQ